MTRTLRSHAGLLVLAVAAFACKSTTTPPTPVPTSITPSATSVEFDALGATQALTATVKDQDGAVMSGQTVTWNSADASTASVSSSGTVTAVANGTTTVTATSGSLTADVSVTVTQLTTQIVKVSGDGQTGAVGDTLANPIVVEQRDSQGHPVPGGTGSLVANSVISFAVASGEGSVATTTETPGADGRASTTWLLGTTAGDQTVTVTTAKATVASLAFSATATAGAADTLAMVSGNNQTAAQTTALTDSLVVRVADAYSNPVPGHTVTFSATGGGGSVSPGTVATGADGRAATEWTLGSGAGQKAEAQAETALTGSPVMFDATAVNLAIVAVAPDTIVEGASATITGTGFDPTPANNTVTIDGTAATVTMASATQLVVTVPTYNCQPQRDVSVQVSVGGANSNSATQPLEPAGLVNLALGEQQIIRDPAQFCLQFTASAVGGDGYVVGVGAAAETPGATMSFTLASVTGASASAPLVGSRPPVRPLSPERRQGVIRADDSFWQRQYRAEAALREWERQVMPTLGPPMRDRRGELASSPAGTLQTQAVGDTVHFRVPDLAAANACTSYKDVTTVTRAIGTAGIWYTDISNPTTDSLTSAEIQGYSDTFDLYIYAQDTLYFGVPSDIDANGRVNIVLSLEVNKFPQGVAGFVFSGDLYSRASCPSSDTGEIFYGHVPDPTNVAGTGARSKAGILYQMPSLIAHEFTHDIQFSRRLVLLGSSTVMAGWAAEGQAMLAQEVVGHSVLGNSTGQNYTSTTALQGQGGRWYGQAFGQLSYYFGRLTSGSKASNAPELCSLFARGVTTPCEGSHFYGASWSFQRYVADRFGPTYSGGEIQLNRDIIGLNPTLQGMANWEAVLGVSLDTVLARWAGMLYGDDRVTGLPAELQTPSWDMFEIFSSYANDTYRLIPVDHQFMAFSDSRGVIGGSTAYTRITSAGARPALAVRARDNSDGVLGTAMKPVLWVLRVQ